jgi:hypothetical protein
MHACSLLVGLSQVSERVIRPQTVSLAKVYAGVARSFVGRLAVARSDLKAGPGWRRGAGSEAVKRTAARESGHRKANHGDTASEILGEVLAPRSTNRIQWKMTICWVESLPKKSFFDSRSRGIKVLQGLEKT